jgi:hypothetical protein
MVVVGDGGGGGGKHTNNFFALLYAPHLVDGDASLIVVHTRQYQIHPALAGIVLFSDAGLEGVKALNGGDVHSVGLNHHIWVDVACEAWGVGGGAFRA